MLKFIACLISCFLIYPFGGNSQVVYDFEMDGISQWMQNPASSWDLAENQSAISGSKSLMHLEKDDAGKDFIYKSISNIEFEDEITWRFLLKHTYNPSASNKWAVLLSANDASAAPNGYAVGVNMRSGISDDRLCLYKVKNGTFEEIIKTSFNWETYIQHNIGAVEVTKSESGLWKIGLGLSDFSNISYAANSVVDVEYKNISYFGIVHVYTKTASKTLFVDDISINSAKIVKEPDTEILPPTQQVSAANISSITIDTTEVFRFDIKDVDLVDTFSTYLQKIVIKNSKPEYEWADIIKQAYIYSPEKLSSTTAITNDSIVFNFAQNLFIASGETSSFSVKILLKDILEDNSVLQFMISKDNSGFIASNQGSGINEPINDIISNEFTVTVEATNIVWKNVPNTVLINNNFDISAEAVDAKGNIDKDFSFVAKLFISDNLYKNSNFVNGKLSETLTHNKAEEITIKLESENILYPNISVEVAMGKSAVILPSPNQIPSEISPEAISADKEVPVFKFVISNYGSNNTETYIKELKFHNPINETNWNNVIAGVSLYNGNDKLITNIIEQKKEYLRIGLFSGSLTIDEGAEKEITLKIWLKSKVADGTELLFSIPKENHGSVAYSNGSGLVESFPQNVVSDTFRVNVKASKLSIKTPSTVIPNAPFTVEVSAVDANGTLDIDQNGNIRIEIINSDGVLSANSGMEKTMVKGNAIWNDLNINSYVMFRIKASHPNLGEIVSGDIYTRDADSYVEPLVSQIQSDFKTVDTLQNDAKEVLRFKIKDAGTSDALPTIIEKMVFNANINLSIIGGVELYADGNKLDAEFEISNEQMSVFPQNLSILDNSEKEISLKIWLKKGKYIDNTKFRIHIQESHGWQVGENSSGLQAKLEYVIYSKEHSINVEPSNAVIIDQPLIVQKNAPFMVKVSAADYNGNVAETYNNAINLVKNNGNGVLQIEQNAVANGIIEYKTLWNAVETFSLKTNSPELKEHISVPLYSASRVDTITNSWKSLSDWTVTGNTIKHNSGNGISTIVTPVGINSDMGIVQWDFNIENGNFNPSANNAFWCVLSSDNENIENDSYFGYVIGVNYTGSSNLISFWKVRNGSKQLLWTSDCGWEANTKMQIIVQRHDGKYWKIYTKEENELLRLVGEFTDGEFIENKYSGFVFRYTTTRQGLFAINNYTLISTDLPLVARNAEIVDKNTIKLRYTTDVILHNSDNYTLVSSSETIPINEIDVNNNEVTLTTGLLSDTLFSLTISGVEDKYGNIIKDTAIVLKRDQQTTSCLAESTIRTEILLTFNNVLLESTASNASNYSLKNENGDIFNITTVSKQEVNKYLINCEPLQGLAFRIYFNNLETQDGFIINDSVSLNKSYQPAQLIDLRVFSPTQLVVEFNKNILEKGNCIVKNSQGKVFNCSLEIEGSKKLSISLTEPLTGNNFTLHISNLRDNEDFLINDSLNFRYQTLSFGDIVFSEIMAKPNPPQGLPNREYVELHNRTNDTLDITDFQIQYSGKSSRITNGKIAPNDYVVICASASVSELLQYGNVFSATSFPTLLDAGMQLSLYSPDNTLVAFVDYNSSYYGDATKSKGGWSLERIDVNNLSDNNNWKASMEQGGGTPCAANSVAAPNPDTEKPFVLNVEIANNLLQIHLNKRVPSDLLTQNNYSISDLQIENINVPDETYTNTFELELSNNLELDKIYNLTLSGIQDMASNIMSDTIIYVFIDAPKVISATILSTTELQLEFSEAMNISDAQNKLNYKLYSGIDELLIQNLLLEPIKRKQLTITTETLKDTLFSLTISDIKDSRGYPIKNTTIEIRREKPAIEATLTSDSRTSLKLSFNTNMTELSIQNTSNYILKNSEGQQFSITSANKQAINCDSLIGESFVLFYNLETETGFTIKDSITLNKSYLPAYPVKVEVLSTSISVEFNKQLLNGGSFLIKNQDKYFEHTSSINNKKLSISLTEPLTGNNFTLYISNLRDNEDFIINDSLNFRYQTLSFGDIVFSEIMAKPNPPQGLPDREYLELYNRTNDTVDISNYRILYGDDRSSRITSGKIPPHGYIVVCASAAVSDLQQYGNVVSATSFPNLLDAGMKLHLVSPDTTLIATVNYNTTFYNNEDKSKGGWAMERIDVNNLSDDNNWKASVGQGGGTPCKENSVSALNTDSIAPYVLKLEIIDNHSIRLVFNENIETNLLSNNTYYNVNNLGNPHLVHSGGILLSDVVELKFNQEFKTGTIYELSVSANVKDLAGNSFVGEIITFGIMPKPQKEDVVINEILFHPRQGASDFVEIYNRSDKIFNLSDMYIASRRKSDGSLQQIHNIAGNKYIYPDDYFVITNDSSSLNQYYYVEIPENVISLKSMPSYPNEEGTVVLLDENQNVIDEFAYSRKMHSTLISNPQGVSLEKIDYNRASNELGNWQSAAQTVGFATPTYQNSCYSHTEPKDEPFSITPTTFSPDGDGYDDHLFIDYKMPDVNYIATITIYNARGGFVKEVCRNTTLGIDGRLVWDGSTNNKQKAPVGPYIILIEAHHPNGNTFKYKKSCVIAERL